MTYQSHHGEDPSLKVACKVALLYVVAPSHQLAQSWAARNGMALGSFKTVTQAFALKGLPVSIPIVLLDTSMRFHDSSVIPLLSKRFTNVRHERY